MFFNSAFLTLALLFSALCTGSAQVPGEERPPTSSEKPIYDPPPGLPSQPYKADGYEIYKRSGIVPAAPAFGTYVRTPAVSGLNVAELPNQHTYEDPTVAYIVAHVPAEAEVYYWDHKKNGTGTMRTYGTPPLEKGKDYYFDVTIRWVEDGEWVSQMTRVHLRAGGTYCVSVVDTKSPALEKDIAASFKKLSPEDAMAAKKQTNCAVQDGVKLGSMGKPVKITINGEPVFLCCVACESAARKDPDKVVNSAKRLREKIAKGLK